MDYPLIILIIFFGYCSYRAGKHQGEIEMMKKLEKDILYVDSLMRAMELKIEYHGTDCAD